MQPSSQSQIPKPVTPSPTRADNSSARSRDRAPSESIVSASTGMGSSFSTTLPSARLQKPAAYSSLGDAAAKSKLPSVLSEASGDIMTTVATAGQAGGLTGNANAPDAHKALAPDSAHLPAEGSSLVSHTHNLTARRPANPAPAASSGRGVAKGASNGTSLICEWSGSALSTDSSHGTQTLLPANAAHSDRVLK